MKKLGFIIRALDMSQMGYKLISESNKFIHSHPDISVTTFIEEYDKPAMQYNFMSSQVLYANEFDGTLISTCISTTNILLNLCGIKGKQIFYVWDLEWIYLANSFKNNINVYNNDNVELIARSIHHYKVLERIWKEPIDIIEDFNHDKFAKYAT